MGSNYYEPPRRAADADLAELAAAVFKTKSAEKQQTALLSAYREAERVDKSLHWYLLKTQNFSKPSMPQLQGIEIEMKLEPENDISNLVAAVKEFSIPTKDFLVSSCPQGGKSEQHVYGTPEEERFIIITNEQGGHLKTKGQNDPYSFGIVGEEYVLRRSEALKQILKLDKHSQENSLLEFTHTLIDVCTPTPVKYRGVFVKEKLTQFCIERENGRVYSIVLGRCTADRHDPLVQLEIEYAGYIPGIINAGKVEDERAIVQDILSLSKKYAPWAPSTRTKFEWLIDKKIKTPQKKETKKEEPEKKKKLLIGGQSFFDDKVD